MSGFHIYRMYYDWGGWTMDVSLCLMYMVAKISLFAWSYTDGARDEEKMNECLFSLLFINHVSD